MAGSPVKLVDAAGRVHFEGTNEAPGGGSGPVKVAVALAFDTAGLAAVNLPITAVDQGAQTFTVAGDHRTAFDRLVPETGGFSVAGSTGNDGFYTVVSTAFAGAHTTVTVVEPLPDATADGEVGVAAGGLAVYTPADGDLLLRAVWSRTTAWNGSHPTGKVYPEQASPFSADLSFDLTIANGAIGSGPDNWRDVNDDNSPASQPPIQLTADGGPLIVIVDDGNGFDPGASAGAGALFLEILAAP